jgi:hypothetical protein
VESYQIAETLQLVIMVAGVALVAFSPLPRALGDWIRHGRVPRPGSSPVVDDRRVDELSGEVASLRQQLVETQERLDFTERMLAKARNKGAVGAGDA